MLHSIHAGRFMLVVLFMFSPMIDAEVRSGETEAARLHDLFDREWNRNMRENPVRASLIGDRRFNRLWTDLGPEARKRRHEQDIAALSELREIDRSALDDADRVNYDLFERRYRNRIEAWRFNMHLIPVSQRGGIQTLDETGNRLRMETVSDYDDWLSRLDRVDELMEQTIDLMREGMKVGMLPPGITMKRVPAQIEKQIVDLAEDSLFYRPFRNMPAAIPQVDRDRIRNRAKSVIEGKVVPAYRKLYRFFVDEYLPVCRKSIAASDLPNGRELYEFRVRQFTTTEMSPDEVHRLGLQEVARIRGEMEEVIRETGFSGTFPAFMDYLRTDPEFYYESSEALYDGYLSIAKRIDPELVHLFGRLPRMPYGVKKIPDAIAPDTTTAYYMRPAADGSRAGYFYVNLYKPETRPKWEMEVLTVHEAVPGHHLQIALQQELETLPNFRRYSGFTVFSEGWGLYSERLGYDLGLYQDPYSRFGQLTYDMWRAVRLVVDTGMHYKGWSREKAIDYFLANAPRQKLDVVNEIDRYISMPGQALAYKVGQLKFLELRARARAALADSFDIREFHDVVLGQGAVPLSVLEAMVDRWIKDKTTRHDVS